MDPTYAERGVHVITGTYTPTHGTPLAGFVVATITVECHVASFTKPADPAAMEYTIYDQQLSFDMAALEYVQSPACNYPYTVDFSWQAGTDTVIQGTTAGLLTAGSATQLVGSPGYTAAMRVAATITITAGADVDHASTQTYVPTDGPVAFDVAIVNPCATATITDLVFTPPAPTVMDGETAYTEWAATTSSVDETHSSPGGFCGAITYAIFTDKDGTDTPVASAYAGDWATIAVDTTGAYRLTFDTTVSQDLLDDEASKAITLYIKSTLTGYDISEYDPIVVTVTAAVCDCSFLQWSAPPVTETTVAVGAGALPATLPLPPSDSSGTATNAAFAKCYFGGNSCDDGGEFEAGSVLYETTSGNVALPSWITFTPSGVPAQDVSLEPDYTSIGEHILIATYTTASGDDPTFTALKITVTCTVTSWTLPSNPSDLVYTVWDQPATFEAADLVYTQDPACGYAYTGAFTFTGTDSNIVAVGSQLIVTADVGTSADNSPYPITTAVVLTVDDPNQSLGDSSFTVPGTVDFKVEIKNPCTTAEGVTIDPIVFTVDAPEVINGEATETEWNAPNTSVDATHSTDGRCGAMSFAVYTDNDGTDTAPTGWAVIEAGVSADWMLTLDTSLDFTLLPAAQDTIDITLYIKKTLDSWGNHAEYQEIVVKINTANCDCQYLLWDLPTTATKTVKVELPESVELVLPTADSTTNQSVHKTFRKCYDEGNPCSEVGSFLSIGALTIDGVAFEDSQWISFTDATSPDYEAALQKIYIDPTAAEIGTHELVVTWTPTHGAASQYTALTLTIECEITSWAAPTLADIAYIVYDAQVSADVSALSYVQTPACGYDYTRAYTWTGVTDPLALEPGNDGRVNIASIKPSQAGTYPLSAAVELTVTNGNNGGTDTFNMDTGADLVELTVTITNPCETTSIEDITFTTSPLVVINGETGFTEWTMPVTALDTAKADTDLCGDVSFEVLLNGNAVVWASTSNQGSNTWRLNIDTT